MSLRRPRRSPGAAFIRTLRRGVAATDERAREVLVIFIIMFVRKKTKLRIAYGLLTFTAFTVIAHNARSRSSLPVPSMEGRPIASQEMAPSPAITRLADSPFPEARPTSMDASARTLALRESVEIPKRAKNAAPSSVYFLTVAIQVDSGAGPITFHRGTRVLLVRLQDGKLLVRHHGTDFLIEKSQVTDNLNALPALARNSS